MVFKRVGSRAYALVTTPEYPVYLAAKVVDLLGDRAAGSGGEGAEICGAAVAKSGHV